MSVDEYLSVHESVAQFEFTLRLQFEIRGRKSYLRVSQNETFVPHKTIQIRFQNIDPLLMFHFVLYLIDF